MITGIIFGFTAVVLTVFAYCVYELSTAEILGNSMKPSFYNGDVLLGDRSFKLSRGDVINFGLHKMKWYEKYFPFLLKQRVFVKRIIGLPGETVDIKNKKVYINGIELIEDYLPADTCTTLHSVRFPLKIPEECVFVLGDNRKSSRDSRDFGVVKTENIISKFFLRVFPKYEML